MEERMSDEIRWLTAETLRGAWEALCHDLSRIVELHSAYAHLQPGGIAHVRLGGGERSLEEVDRCVMGCLAADALYRHETDRNETEVVLQFRNWWRRSVPFLVDPDGDTHRYRYERVPADGPPAPPDEV